MKLLRFIANVTGLTEKIQRETLIGAGKRMRDYAPWFTDGIMYTQPKNDVYNALMLYSQMLRLGHWGATGNSAYEIRDKVYEAKGERLPDEDVAFYPICKKAG